MSQHTPGPWSLDLGATDDGEHGINADAPGEGRGGKWAAVATAHIGQGGGGSWPVKDDEAEANARLIAAAPELLAALDEAIPYLEYLASNGSGNEDAAKTVRTAWAVVAKARGTP